MGNLIGYALARKLLRGGPKIFSKRAKIKGIDKYPLWAVAFLQG